MRYFNNKNIVQTAILQSGVHTAHTLCYGKIATPLLMFHNQSIFYVFGKLQGYVGQKEFRLYDVLFVFYDQYSDQ